MKNNILKAKLVEHGIMQKQIAKKMGISPRMFNRKINMQVINGSTTRFTEAEAEWLAEFFHIELEQIKR